MVLQPGHSLRVILLELREARRGLGFSRFALGAGFLDAEGRSVSLLGERVGGGVEGKWGQMGGRDLPFVGEDACGDDEGCHCFWGGEV